LNNILQELNKKTLEVLLLQQELTTKMSNEKIQQVPSTKPGVPLETKPTLEVTVETKKPTVPEKSTVNVEPKKTNIQQNPVIELKKTVEVKKSNSFDFDSNDGFFTGSSNSFSGKTTASLDDFMSGKEDSTGLGHIVDQLDQREKEKKSLDFLDKVLHIENKPQEMIKFGDEKKGSILGLFDSNEFETKETPKANTNLGGGLDDFF
jgi:hypothetical protein